MKVILEAPPKHVLRCDPGEEMLGEIRKFCDRYGIRAGVFSAIGAAQEVVLSWYNVEAKHYQDHALTRKFEIVGLSGNISTLNNQIVIHAHGSFSDVELHTRSGHVKKLVVSATGEIILEALSGEIQRKHSAEVGLNLMD